MPPNLALARASRPTTRLRESLLAVFQGAERVFDAAFGSALSPLRHLGATAFMMLALLVASGVYLYAVLDTSALLAYPSIERLAHEQRYFGGVLRSLHRYAADAFVIVLLLHLLREGLYGRYRAFRRFSWLTGVPLLGFAFVSASCGLWLNWDLLGQYSALATAEWLDWWPFFASPLTRNFLNAAAVSDRLFSLFVFVHLGVPLLMLFGLWFHVQRISRAALFPPRRLFWGTLAALLLLALVQPVLSHAPADLARVPGALAYDWLLLFIHPLTEASSAGFTWGMVMASFALLFALPYLPRRAPVVPVAVVDPDNCNGCRRCFDDCPYAAVTMLPHPNRRIARQMAVVDAELCASCGICVGACPSSTPFRSGATLRSGIDMPGSPIDALRHSLRQSLRQSLAGLRSERRIVVFGCDCGARVDSLAAPDVAAFSLMCTGMLPPSFVEYALRDGADAVLVSGCAPGGCEFRLGQRWAAQRLAGEREPQLRASVPRERLGLVWAGAGDEAGLRAALDALRRGIDVSSAPAPRANEGVARG